MKIAILYICTGQYIKFWKEFYKSFETYFLTQRDKEYFVFTDSHSLYDEENNSRIHRIEQKDLGWPGNTLFRFHMFVSIQEQLANFEYIFFMNANVVCMRNVTEEMFLPVQQDLLVVQHPSFYNYKPFEYSYDRNRKSNAYIPYWKGKVYVCGGINGGKTKAYIRLITELRNRIQADYNKGVIAKWHDESHLNHYILEHENYRLLTPSYCFPEGSKIPFEPILMVRDKEKVIDIDERKKSGQTENVWVRRRKKIIHMIAKRL